MEELKTIELFQHDQPHQTLIDTRGSVIQKSTGTCWVLLIK
jgi:hypothetical protein